MRAKNVNDFGASLAIFTHSLSAAFNSASSARAGLFQGGHLRHEAASFSLHRVILFDRIQR